MYLHLEFLGRERESVYKFKLVNGKRFYHYITNYTVLHYLYIILVVLFLVL